MRKKPKSKKERQLNLGLKESPKNFFLKIKLKISKFLIRFEIKEFLKSPLTWFVVIFSLSFIATQIYILINNIDTYPKQLPVWQNQTSSSERLANKEYLYVFPSMSAMVILLGVVFSNIFFHREKFLSKILLISVLLSIIGLTIAFLKLIPTV